VVPIKDELVGAWRGARYVLVKGYCKGDKAAAKTEQRSRQKTKDDELKRFKTNEVFDTKAGRE